ncbi:MAG: imidazole glycerol phosphate synthase subunit HisH [Acidobacteria bacterium]|nr:imidazole glycerol phosphate synthase subunit HisH [Acidobacteriota bacterium]MDP7340231.1 imidazole glycerol phosphate synthase subunit HisH [Vicinamibacterales bacterium]MDP7479058.1 imidazole glycerol phosphate synthase subunit HisH [Vicinamibacterales bacterium]MDP7691598.1 imidazole glycerol phosphate synthase subunit HisH [Vicinamibacterales bacterium]HJN44648.1 imidazole glycerol phosphate synthase subunit HisH [Vicinamibacterales bacterium]
MIALIDYGAGNLTSVRKALAHLGAAVTTPHAPADLASAGGIIVPGVGNFGVTAALGPDWRTAIRSHIDHQRPLLGICVGMQWLFDGSEEAPGHSGLELLAGTCRLLAEEESVDGQRGTTRFKVPHVGWNSLHLTKRSWLLDGVAEGDQVYFTHSFAAPVTTDCVGATQYGVAFAAAVERDYVGGVQFHPEKSSDVGLRILTNFLRKVT